MGAFRMVFVWVDDDVCDVRLLWNDMSVKDSLSYSHTAHLSFSLSHTHTHLISQITRVLTFGSYEIYKQSLLTRFPNVKPTFIYALSAILGDITGSGWLCPSEVMKQQLQAGIYGNMGEAVRGIWKKSGLRGFYQVRG